MLTRADTEAARSGALEQLDAIEQVPPQPVVRVADEIAVTGQAVEVARLSARLCGASVRCLDRVANQRGRRDAKARRFEATVEEAQDDRFGMALYVKIGEVGRPTLWVDASAPCEQVAQPVARLWLGTVDARP